MDFHVRGYDGKTKLKRGHVVYVRCTIATDYGKEYVCIQNDTKYPSRDAIVGFERYEIEIGDRVLCGMGKRPGCIVSSVNIDGKEWFIIQIAGSPVPEFWEAGDNIFPVRDPIDGFGRDGALLEELPAPPPQSEAGE